MPGGNRRQLFVSQTRDVVQDPCALPECKICDLGAGRVDGDPSRADAKRKRTLVVEAGRGVWAGRDELAAESCNAKDHAGGDVEVHVALAKSLLLANQTEPAVGHLKRALELAKQAKQDSMISNIEVLLSRFDTTSPPGPPSNNETNQ